MKIKYLFLYILSIFFLNLPSLARSFTLGIENDFFIHDDSDYSHGTEITYLDDETKLWKFDNWGIDVLQNIYTPDKISSSEIQYGDRPYCGLLLASFMADKIYNETLTEGNISIRQMVGIGAVGDASFAKTSQKTVHKIIGSKDPKGWQYQIKDEPILQLQTFVDWNVPIIEKRWFSIYAIPRTYLFAGNFKDQIGCGLDCKLGLNPRKNLGNNYSFSASYPSRSTHEYPTNPKDARMYLLIGIEGKYVLWDTSLDGNMFRDSIYSIDSNDLVGEAHFGVGLGYSWLDLNVMIIARTKEYETQDEAPTFGRAAISIRF